MKMEKGCRVRCLGGTFQNRTGTVMGFDYDRALAYASVRVRYDGWGPTWVAEPAERLQVIETAAQAALR